MVNVSSRNHLVLQLQRADTSALRKFSVKLQQTFGHCCNLVLQLYTADTSAKRYIAAVAADI